MKIPNKKSDLLDKLHSLVPNEEQRRDHLETITFYKFLKKDDQSVLSILNDKKIWYSNPSLFNDPFEFAFKTLPVTGGTRERAIKSKMVPEELKEKIKSAYTLGKVAADEHTASYIDEKKRAGVFCASTRFNEILMWSHYSDNHEGICLKFEIQAYKLNSQDIKFYYHDKFGFITPINYTPKYPKQEVFRKMIDHYNGKSSLKQKNDAILEEVVMHYSTKSINWDYEEEIRCLRSPSTGGSGLQEFTKDSLKSIILGCKINDDFKIKIYELVKEYGAELEIIETVMSQEKYELIPYKPKS